MRKFLLLSALVLMVGVVPLVEASPVQAATAPLECQLSMQVAVKFVPLTGVATYTVLFGGGSCFADGAGTSLATVIGGTGTSTGFGPGDACPTSSTTDFRLTLDLELLNTSTGKKTTSVQTLSAPGLNDLPGTQPVTATSPGKGTGAGVFSYRLYHQCPPAGENSALYNGLLAT